MGTEQVLGQFVLVLTLEPYSSTELEVGTLVAVLGTGHVVPMVPRG